MFGSAITALSPRLETSQTDELPTLLNRFPSFDRQRRSTIGVRRASAWSAMREIVGLGAVEPGFITAPSAYFTPWLTTRTRDGRLLFEAAAWRSKAESD